MNLTPWRKPQLEERDSYPLAFQEWAQLFNVFSYGGSYYNLNLQQTLTGATESIPADFPSLARNAYQANGIVFACMLTRMLHFSQARFQWQDMGGGRPGKLFGTPALAPLEKPWPQGTTSDLLTRMIGDADIAGNFFAVRQPGGALKRLRPDWTYIVLGSRSGRADWESGDPDTELVGYEYYPGGLHSGREPYRYFTEQIVHWAPIPDPLAEYRGMSWLTPVIREIQADQSMTSHRQKFFDQGATVNMVVKVPATTPESFDKWVQKLEEGHRGAANAYKTMYLAQGADVQPVGSDFQQNDFKIVQGAGEVRIATAARIPATILGISEGLQGSTLNAGNYGSARRNFADGCLRPLWGGACGALEVVVKVPPNSRLWFDERDIPLLKEDFKDAAEVRREDAVTVRQLVDAGYKPDAVIDAVTSDDFSLLKNEHSGLFSVQLQPPNSGGTPQPITSGTV